MVRWGLASPGAVLLASACASPSGGFASPVTTDGGTEGGRDATAITDSGQVDETPAEATAAVDATCVVPSPATGVTSTRCTPDGPGSWACGDASGSGWLYSCQETTAGAHPQSTLAGACSSAGTYDYADASYALALCATAACTGAAQYDDYCDSGTAVACPDTALEAGAGPAKGCALSFIGQWSSGQGLPGPLYCCP